MDSSHLPLGTTIQRIRPRHPFTCFPFIFRFTFHASINALIARLSLCISIEDFDCAIGTSASRVVFLRIRRGDAPQQGYHPNDSHQTHPTEPPEPKRSLVHCNGRRTLICKQHNKIARSRSRRKRQCIYVFMYCMYGGGGENNDQPSNTTNPFLKF